MRDSTKLAWAPLPPLPVLPHIQLPVPGVCDIADLPGPCCLASNQDKFLGPHDTDRCEACRKGKCSAIYIKL